MEKRLPREKRTPINGTRNILTIRGQEPGYRYRIVNDDGDRIPMLQEQGYELVQDASITVGDRRIANPTKEGSPVQVSVGGGKKGFVMRIKEEWYQEDQKTKQKAVDDLDESMKANAKKIADYGSLKIS
ncbi:MAG TPA: hypothetical protein PKA15_03685 [Chitinophagales bacterium]|nr:hypothetical protein [Chitinophagales bacterium]HMY41924.1 hypothetical protein [Chitinophagales bacterium]